MQRFNAPLTTEDRQFARRIGRIILAAYTSTALALSAGVVAHIALKNRTTVNAPVEASAKTGTIGVQRRLGFCEYDRRIPVPDIFQARCLETDELIDRELCTRATANERKGGRE
jgi:hypothetical protein